MVRVANSWQQLYIATNQHWQEDVSVNGQHNQPLINHSNTMAKSNAQMLHSALAVYCSETTIGNLVWTTRPPSQIWPWQQNVLHPDGQWQQVHKNPLQLWQEPSWTILQNNSDKPRPQSIMKGTCQWQNQIIWDKIGTTAGKRGPRHTGKNRSTGRTRMEHSEPSHTRQSQPTSPLHLVRHNVLQNQWLT
jgi:hypothetical protein